MNTNKLFQIKKVLSVFKRIAVVGLSPNPERPSYGVSEYMQSHGYDIIPIRPAVPGEASAEPILGVKPVASLSEVSPPAEIVNVFRKSDAVPEIVDEAIKVKAKVLWLQEGVTHPVAEEKARKAGILVFSDLCILKEHARLFSKS